MGGKYKSLMSGFVALGVVLGAQTAAAESLRDALIAAYSSNPTLLAERARLRATDEGSNQARAGWRPTVTVSGTASRAIDRRQFAQFFGGQVPTGLSNTETDTNSYTAQVTASQPLFRGFQTLNATRAADARVRGGRANLWLVEQQVLLDTVTAYRDVIRDSATVNLRENNVQVLRRQLQASQDRFRVGEITRTDVAQSEARLSRSQSDLTRAQAALSESRARYAVVVGQAPGSLEESSTLPGLPSSLEQAIEMARANNPSLIAALENEKASKSDVAQAKGGLLPSVEFQGTASNGEDFNFDNSQNSSVRALVQVNIPIYQAGSQYSRIRQAKHTHSQSRLQVAEAERSVIQAATNAWQNLNTAQATIQSDLEQVRANEIAFEGVRQEAQVGSRTTLDVLDAEQELLDARVALVQSQRDELVAAYQLLSAIGGLTAENLGLDVDLYDPTANYRSVKNKLIGYGTND